MTLILSWPPCGAGQSAASLLSHRCLTLSHWCVASIGSLGPASAGPTPSCSDGPRPGLVVQCCWAHPPPTGFPPAGRGPGQRGAWSVRNCTITRRNRVACRVVVHLWGPNRPSPKAICGAIGLPGVCLGLTTGDNLLRFAALGLPRRNRSGFAHRSSGIPAWNHRDRCANPLRFRFTSPRTRNRSRLATPRPKHARHRSPSRTTSAPGIEAPHGVGARGLASRPLATGGG